MKYQHFSVEEREKIQEMWWSRKSIRSIARALNRSPSSVSRELRRNFPPERQVYTPRLAHERALKQRKSRGRKERLKNEAIRRYVTAHLRQNWSPEQIAGRIRLEGTGNISHEAIYQYIYALVRPSDGLPRSITEDLRIYLRRRHRQRVNKGGRRAWRLMRPHGPSIDDRPLAVAQKVRIGDWESDSVESVDHKPGVNTLLERKTGLFLITKLKDKTSASTVSAISQRLEFLPEPMKQTITFDNGPENSGWRTLEKLTGIHSFFAHPYHSWERGANENTNGLLREYFPKKTDFGIIPDKVLAEVEYRLNSRPRKRLGFRTPLEVISVALQG